MCSRDLILPCCTRRPSFVQGVHLSLSSSRPRPRPRPRPRRRGLRGRDRPRAAVAAVAAAEAAPIRLCLLRDQPSCSVACVLRRDAGAGTKSEVSEGGRKEKRGWTTARSVAEEDRDTRAPLPPGFEPRSRS